MSEFNELNGVLVPRSYQTDRYTTEALVSQLNTQAEFFQERLADLEMALEDVGWVRQSWATEHEFSRDGLRTINKLARMMYLKNPLIRRGVDVQAHYVFGQGVSVHSSDKDVDRVIQDWMDDEANRVELTTQAAQVAKERELSLFGNLYFVLFTNPTSGRVRVRSIPEAEVADIITDPDDAKSPWFYRREWTESRIDPATGDQVNVHRRAYYVDWHYNPPLLPDAIGDVPVIPDGRVYHVKVGGLSDMKFGVSEVYPAIDWARAYKEFLEDWATLTRAYSRFAYKLTLPDGVGKRGLAAAKAKMGTTLSAGASSYTMETSPPPNVGSIFTRVGADHDIEPIRIGGANVSAEDGRRLMLMVAASFGLPESFFGDVSVGTLATAKSLDRPTELKMRDRQQLWADVFKRLCYYVVLQAAQAGQLPSVRVEPDDDGTPKLFAGTDPLQINVDFPPLLEHDVGAQVSAIVDAATLRGAQVADHMDKRDVARMLLTALGEDDIDEILGRVFPQGEDTRGGAADSQRPSVEARMSEAVSELRAELARIAEKYGG